MTDNQRFELSPIKAMELAASKIPDVISLAQGIPSFATPAAIREFVQEKINQGACDKYSLTIGLAELREEIALSLSREGLSYDPDSEILATAGSIEGITASILSCTSPGDEVIMPSPSYVSYRGALGIARCTPVFVPLDEDNNFDFHVEAIEKAITKKTRAILYCSPNNPTGTLFSEEKTRRLINVAEKHDLYVIVDEVYKDFYYSDDRHFSATLIPEARDRVIRVCSFSKAFAMTGWRIGFVHGAAKNIGSMVKFHDAMVTCAPVVSQYAAIGALRYGEPYLQDFRRIFRERRDYTIACLDKLSHIFDYQMPKATYFVFPRIKDTVPLAHDSTALAYDILNKVKVALVPGVAFGPSGESHLRITYGRGKEDLEEAMQRLSDYFSGTHRGDTARTTAFPAPAPRTAHAPISRTLAAAGLSIAARLYLKRNKPVVVGIMGVRSKTVYKRIIAECLNRKFPARANMLSYNTEIGLPVSVLKLPLPKNFAARLLFPFLMAGSALFSGEDSKVLILEYGVTSAKDAKNLARIALPDWLVISDIENDDPSINQSGILEGIKYISSKLPSDRIIWPAEDAIVKSLRSDLNPNLAFGGAEKTQNSLNKHLEAFQGVTEPVSPSARNALISAAILSEQLASSPHFQNQNRV